MVLSAVSTQYNLGRAIKLLDMLLSHNYCLIQVYFEVKRTISYLFFITLSKLCFGCHDSGVYLEASPTTCALSTSTLLFWGRSRNSSHSKKSATTGYSTQELHSESFQGRVDFSFFLRIKKIN